MAGRGRKKKPSVGEELALLFVGGCYAVWNYMKENPLESMLIGLVVFLLLAWALTARRRKWAKYIKWFYNRERRIQELGIDSYMDKELTETILEAYEDGEQVTIENYFVPYNGLDTIWEIANQSKKRFVEGGDAIYSDDKGLALKKYGIASKKEPLVFRCVGENDGGYVFYVYAKTVLAFIEGPQKTVFLAAYRPECIQMHTEQITKIFSVVVHEKTQYDIRYYDKFSPASDAEIVHSRWKVVNKNGSRSFKGGLLPENNPLFFELLFGKFNFAVGNYSASMSYSNYDAIEGLTHCYNKFLSEWNPDLVYYDDNHYESVSTEDEDVNNEYHDAASNANEAKGISEEELNDAFSRTDATIESTDKTKVLSDSRTQAAVNMDIDTNIAPIKLQSPINDTEESESTKEQTSDDSSVIEEVRSRNREVAKSAVNRLNANYAGLYEFKVYQVRKPRDGWGLQDAGVYAYSTDAQGNQFTIEFDLITNLDKKQTDLRFSVWGKTRELVANRYKTTVTKGKMNISGEGYGLIIHRDYESMSHAEMLQQFEKDTLTLMKLIEMDVPTN